MYMSMKDLKIPEVGIKIVGKGKKTPLVFTKTVD